MDLIDRFGADIEYDLLDRFGIAIHDYIAGRRPWAQLERLIARLPRHSHYKAALEDDEDFARVALALKSDDDPPRTRVPLVGYDETVVRLDNLFDAINAVRETLISVYSKRKGRAGQPTRATRPETAQQRVKRQQARVKLDSIVDKMTGGR